MSFDILVVGAGISGLCCAKYLQAHDLFTITIAESANVVGGRISTKYFVDNGCGTYKLEMGANWIHGIQNNPIHSIAEENKLYGVGPREVKGPERYGKVHLLEDGSDVPKQILQECNKYYYKYRSEAEEFFAKGCVPRRYGNTQSVEQYVMDRFTALWKEKHYRGSDLDMRRAIVKRSLHHECSLSGCDSMAQVSLQQFGSYEELAGSQPVLHCGYVKVVECVAEGIPKERILLGTEVTSVTNDTQPQRMPCSGCRTTDKCSTVADHCDRCQGDGVCETKVKVTYSNGVVGYFDHVVFTGSLGYLKGNHKSLFVPPLSTEKQQAINVLGIGTVDKIFLKFENLDFLPGRTRVVNLYWSKCEKKTRRSTECSDGVPDWTRKITHFNVAPTPNADMLEAWITGREAEQMESLSEAQVGEDCAKLLQKFLRVHVPKPVQVIRTTWGSHPFTRGSYSYVAVGSTVQHIEDLAKPVYENHSGKPLILFAGEATHPRFYSTTHGAYLSGQRAAQTLIDYHACSSKPQLSGSSQNGSGQSICNRAAQKVQQAERENCLLHSAESAGKSPDSVRDNAETAVSNAGCAPVNPESTFCVPANALGSPESAPYNPENECDNTECSW